MSLATDDTPILIIEFTLKFELQQLQGKLGTAYKDKVKTLLWRIQHFLAQYAVSVHSVFVHPEWYPQLQMSMQEHILCIQLIV